MMASMRKSSIKTISSGIQQNSTFIFLFINPATILILFISRKGRKEKIFIFKLLRLLRPLRRKVLFNV
jgi:hypothetical protein